MKMTTPITASITTPVRTQSRLGTLDFPNGFPTEDTTAKVYRLADAKKQPTMKFLNVSGKEVNTIHANDFHFFEELDQIIQTEPNQAYSAEILGMLAAIGIEKSKTFAPDAKLKKTLSQAVAVGNATARTIVFKTRMEEAYYYPNSAWFTGFVGGSYEFLSQPGVRNLEARDLFHYYATGITPAMALKMVGIGSQYALATTDAKGKGLGGAYKVMYGAGP